MKQTIHDLAAQAAGALRALTASLSPKPREAQAPVCVVRGRCRVCGRIHRMGLGAPRCTAPLLGPIADPKPFFFAAAVAVGCLAISGCANSPFYVSGVYAKAEMTDTSKDGTVGIEISPNPYAYKASVPVQTISK